MDFDIFTVDFCCKGKDEDIALFQNEAKKIMPSFEGIYPCYFVENSFCLSGGKYKCDGNFYDIFLPLIEKFTVETAKPLDFFVILRPEVDYDTNRIISGYVIFENGKKVKENDDYLDLTTFIPESIEEQRENFDGEPEEFDEDVASDYAGEEAGIEMSGYYSELEFSAHRWYEGKSGD